MGIQKIVVLVSLMLLIIVQCRQKDNKRKIVVFCGCDNIEIVHDINLSITNNEKLFRKFNIEIEHDSLEQTCGYLLINDGDKLSLKSALTDVDLMTTVSNFYN